MQALWTVALVLLLISIAILTGSAPLNAAALLRWTGIAMGLAGFPAGVAVAESVLEARPPYATAVKVLLAAIASASVLFALIAVTTPLLGDDGRTWGQLARDMHDATTSWEKRNDAAWQFYVSLCRPVQAVLVAAIGVQAGVWSRYAVPPLLRGILYWAIGLGLLLSGYAVFDSTYEAIVIHTAGDVGFAAFYTLLIPAGICAGLLLPTIALWRGAHVRGIGS
jgi:hypothetical protein